MVETPRKMCQQLLESLESAESRLGFGTMIVTSYCSVGKEKNNPGRPPQFTQLDRDVFSFLEAERSEGRAVSNKQLILHAKQCAAGKQHVAKRMEKKDLGWEYGTGRTGLRKFRQILLTSLQLSERL